MNALDRFLLEVAPGLAAKRMRARYQARVMAAAYEAAEPGRLRKKSRDYGSGNAAVALGGAQPRLEARHLDRNHDIVRNGINTLVQNIVGANGIGVEPQPRDANGDVHEDLADQLQRLWRNWCKRPEVTRQHDWASAQRLMARTWVRDGEVLFQDLVGLVPFLEHSMAVPYSLELIEPDLLPLDYSDTSLGILQGVERNAWGRPVAYHLYKQHPGDPNGIIFPDRKRVSADFVRHVKLIDRIGQVRGVSILASVITRLEDLKDYEESERIAAKIAASMAAVIIKGDPTMYPDTGYVDANGNATAERQMRFQPGMIFDNMRPGEDVKTIDTNRPNPNLQTYRDGQLRAAAGGMCISYSSFSKNYNGTYSAQRQELVEQYGAYGVLAFEMISQCQRPVYERFVQASYASGQLKVPPSIDPAGLIDALYLAPQMPWIDPQKEADAMATLEDNVYISGPEVIRRRGANPRDVLDQESAWQKRLRAWGLQRIAKPASPAPAPATTTTEGNP